MSNSNFIIVKEELFSQIDARGDLLKYKPEQFENQFPQNFSLKFKKDSPILINTSVNLILNLSIKCFNIPQSSTEWIFDGLEYIFGKENISSNRETNFLKPLPSGIVNTTAKIAIVVNNLVNYKNAKKLVIDYLEWLAKIEKLDEYLNIYSLERRLTFTPAFSIDYDLSAAQKVDEYTITNLGIMAFGDKIYTDIKDPSKSIVKDYTFLFAPTENNQYLQEVYNGTEIENVKLPEYKSWLKNTKGIRSHFKVIDVDRSNPGMKSLDYKGSIIVPIYKNMKFVLLATFNSNPMNNRTNDLSIPMIMKEIDLGVELDKEKLKNKEIDYKSLSLNSSRAIPVTLPSLTKLINVISNRAGSYWVKDLYLNRSDKFKNFELVSDYIKYALSVLERSLCYNLTRAEIDKLCSFKTQQKQTNTNNKAKDISDIIAEREEEGSDTTTVSQEEIGVEASEENTEKQEVSE